LKYQNAQIVSDASHCTDRPTRRDGPTLQLGLGDRRCIIMSFHVRLFAAAAAVFQLDKDAMKRPFANDHHSSSKRPRTFGHDGIHQNHSQSRHARSSGTSSSSSIVQQAGPQPDPAKHLESLLKVLLSHQDSTKQLLGQDAYDGAVRLSKSLSSINTATKSLELFQPSTIKDSEVGSHLHNPPIFSASPTFSLPELPQVPEGPYSQAPFIHKSNSQHDRTSAIGDMTYERLEFLGDAYLEVIATRLIFSRYPHLAAGRQAQIRERLVKNDTLTRFSAKYRFQDRLKAGQGERELAKASGKILADVFEAYVAAIILSDPQDGFKRAEIWLTELWAPILLEEFGPISSEFNEYNQNAKQELQQKIVGKDIKLDYVETRPMQQTKHLQRYYISLYLTGWGHEKRLLGSGEGQNKVEAGNRAAMDAMVKSKHLVDDAARQLHVLREQRKADTAAKHDR
jgi:ribonuclease-3